MTKFVRQGVCCDRTIVLLTKYAERVVLNAPLTTNQIISKIHSEPVSSRANS